MGRQTKQMKRKYDLHNQNETWNSGVIILMVNGWQQK